MAQTTNKIAGWALLVLGMAMIFWGVFSAYDIFTGKKQAPAIFSFSVTNKDLAELENNGEKTVNAEKIDIEKYKNISQEDLQNLQQMQGDQAQSLIKESVKEQIERMIPADSITKIMNLSSWSMFVFILIYAGGKIAGLGIKLVKDKNNI